MPKADLLKRIDARSGTGLKVASASFPSTQGLGDADTVDGLHASRIPLPNTLLALNARAKFPWSVIEGYAPTEYRGSSGRIVIGPTTYLLRDLAAADTTMYVAHEWFEANEYAILSRGEGQQEIIKIVSAPTAGSDAFTYTIERDADGLGAFDWATGVMVISMGAAGEGYMEDVAVDVTGDNLGPYRDMFSRDSDSATNVVRRLRIGNLKGILGTAITMFGFACGDLRDGSRSYFLANRYGVELHGGNAIGYDPDGNPAWGLFSRDSTVAGVGAFAAGDSWFGFPGREGDWRANIVVQGSLGRVVFRAGLTETLVIDGEAQTILGLTYIGHPFGPAIVLGGGKQIRARNADGVDGFVVMAGTDEDPDELYIQLGWSDPYSPKVLLTNAGLVLPAEALVGVMPPGAVSVDAGDIVSGTLSTDRFSAYDDLGVEGHLDNDADGDLLTRVQADGRFVNEGQAAGGDLAGTYPNPTVAWENLVAHNDEPMFHNDEAVYLRS